MKAKLLQKRGTNYSWFQPGFDPEIKSFIMTHQFPNPGLGCWDETNRWAKVLLEAGYDVERCGGMFAVQGDINDNEGHYWLEVEGSIFDPTAAQFDGEKDSDYYAMDEYEDADELRERLGLL